MTGTVPGTQESGIESYKPKRPLVFEKLFRGEKPENKQLLELTEQVAKKLMKNISEEGVVMFIYKKGAEIPDRVSATVCLESPKIPCLLVKIRGETTPPTQSSINFHYLFDKPLDRKYISAIEESPSKTHRAIAVIQSWLTPEGSFEINYRRNAREESPNQVIPRSNREKIKFLEQILETTVDPVGTSRPFGRLYVPGDTKSDKSSSDGTIYHIYWARDLKNLPPGILGGSQPKLTG